MIQPVVPAAKSLNSLNYGMTLADRECKRRSGEVIVNDEIGEIIRRTRNPHSFLDIVTNLSRVLKSN